MEDTASAKQAFDDNYHEKHSQGRPKLRQKDEVEAVPPTGGCRLQIEARGENRRYSLKCKTRCRANYKKNIKDKQAQISPISIREHGRLLRPKNDLQAVKMYIAGHFSIVNCGTNFFFL